MSCNISYKIIRRKLSFREFLRFFLIIFNSVVIIPTVIIVKVILVHKYIKYLTTFFRLFRTLGNSVFLFFSFCKSAFISFFNMLIMFFRSIADIFCRRRHSVYKRQFGNKNNRNYYQYRKYYVCTHFTEKAYKKVSKNSADNSSVECSSGIIESLNGYTALSVGRKCKCKRSYRA